MPTAPRIYGYRCKRASSYSKRLSQAIDFYCWPFQYSLTLKPTAKTCHTSATYKSTCALKCDLVLTFGCTLNPATRTKADVVNFTNMNSKLELNPLIHYEARCKEIPLVS